MPKKSHSTYCKTFRIMERSLHPLARIFHLLREEKSDISSIYFYAIFNGLIQLTLPVGIQAIIGFVVAGSLSASLVVLVSLIVGGVLVVGLLQMAQMKVIEKIQQTIFVRYAYAFASRIPKLNLQGVDGYYLPELVNRFFDTVSLQKSISKLLLDLPVAVIQILFGLLLLSFYHPAFILFGILLLGVLWIILYLTGARGLSSSLAESSHKYALAGWFEELARAVHSFKFAGSALPIRKADEKTTAYLGARSTHFKVLLTQYRALVAFKVLITAAMLIVGVALLLNQQINIGQFVAAEIIIVTVIASVEKIIGNLDSVYDVLTSVEKLAKLTDKPLEQEGTYAALPEPQSIEARALSFSYSDRLVLSKTSFRIEAGAKACISGAEGSGKSSLLRLLTGAYPQFSGALLIGGVPIANYDLDVLRSQMGISLLQDAVFHGTLLENLTFGRAADAAYLTQLMELTGLSSFLASLPRGYDTQLDPAGRRLPQGVVHKISLVRALALRPRLLLFEDPGRHLEDPVRTRVAEYVLALPATVVIASNDAIYRQRCTSLVELAPPTQNA
ncbi:MAG: ATP-binding cassette domain-containing protein [Chitinophagaceae bacterium]|nr:MAG: ATP-binding cassette domain-containing protein [Chitinophagaceae bacterium]